MLIEIMMVVEVIEDIKKILLNGIKQLLKQRGKFYELI